MGGTGFGADRFGWTDEALAELRALRGWTEAAIERLELEWLDRERRVVFTVTDETLAPVGRLRYLPDPRRNGQTKMLADAGSERQLFPAPETLGDDVRAVLLTEGEPDEVAALSAGFAAIAVPGVGGWQPEYAARFRGRRWIVYVVFDCDESGRRAAAEVAVSLVEAGVDARIVDLDPERDDKHDLTDYLLERGAGALRELMAAAEPYQPTGDELDGTDDEAGLPIIFERLGAFLDRQLPPAESLVGVARGGTNLLPRYGWVMPWGPAGSGKTSVVVDLLFYAATGLDWLGWEVARPLRFVLVVNEGVPGGFQDKLAAKVEAWPGDRDAVLDNIAVYASPWGEFTFRSERMADHARAFALDFGADYVALDPLHTLGTTGAGSPQDTEAFKNDLRAFGLWADLGVITAHHSNKSGMVSGDWARHADTVIHLEKDGRNPATKLTLEKARPADPAELGVPVLLEWLVDTLGYKRNELSTAIVSDGELLKRVLDYLDKYPDGVGMTELKKEVTGAPTRIGTVVTDAIERGIVANRAQKRGTYLLSKVDPTYDEVRRLGEGEQTRMDTGETSNVDPTYDDDDDAKTPEEDDVVGPEVLPGGEDLRRRHTASDDEEDESWF